MRSLRARITIIAVVVTAIALVLASAVLLRGLRSSMLEQLDDSVSDQAFDYAVNVTDTASLEGIGSLNDLDTLLVIFDETGGEPWLANDLGVRVDEVVAELPVARSLDAYDPLVVDASIESATDTTGSESMRAAITPLVLDDLAEADPVVYVLVGRSSLPIDETVTSTRNQLAALVPALALVVGALAWWITGRALRPVERLRTEVQNITAGDLRQRVSEPGSADEIDRLALTMNDMLERLDGSVRQQQQFVSDAAHELRTPLASMAAQLDVDATHPDTADHATTATNLRGEVDRMQTMIDSLLMLARSDQGRLEGVDSHRLLDLDELVHQAASRVPKPTHLTLDVSGLTPVEVRGDQGQLHRIIDNLLANAYRHASTRVAVATGVDHDGVWLSVDDDGSGVPEAHREVVFERFVRLDEARSRDQGGSGLGLALSRELAVAHGGSLFVVDSALGGAQFVVRLPGAG